MTPQKRKATDVADPPPKRIRREEELRKEEKGGKSVGRPRLQREEDGEPTGSLQKHKVSTGKVGRSRGRKSYEVRVEKGASPPSPELEVSERLRLRGEQRNTYRTGIYQSRKHNEEAAVDPENQRARKDRKKGMQLFRQRKQNTNCFVDPWAARDGISTNIRKLYWSTNDEYEISLSTKWELKCWHWSKERLGVSPMSLIGHQIRNFGAGYMPEHFAKKLIELMGCRLFHGRWKLLLWGLQYTVAYRLEMLKQKKKTNITVPWPDTDLIWPNGARISSQLAPLQQEINKATRSRDRKSDSRYVVRADLEYLKKAAVKVIEDWENLNPQSIADENGDGWENFLAKKRAWFIRWRQSQDDADAAWSHFGPGDDGEEDEEGDTEEEEEDEDEVLTKSQRRPSSSRGLRRAQAYGEDDEEEEDEEKFAENTVSVSIPRRTSNREQEDGGFSDEDETLLDDAHFGKQPQVNKAKKVSLNLEAIVISSSEDNSDDENGCGCIYITSGSEDSSEDISDDEDRAEMTRPKSLGEDEDLSPLAANPGESIEYQGSDWEEFRDFEQLSSNVDDEEEEDEEEKLRRRIKRGIYEDRRIYEEIEEEDESESDDLTQ